MEMELGRRLPRHTGSQIVLRTLQTAVLPIIMAGLILLWELQIIHGISIFSLCEIARWLYQTFAAAFVWYFLSYRIIFGRWEKFSLPDSAGVEWIGGKICIVSIFLRNSFRKMK